MIKKASHFVTGFFIDDRPVKLSWQARVFTIAVLNDTQLARSKVPKP